MPASLTAVANLALDLIGEPYLTDYATDTGTTADAVRLHLPHILATVLEGHPWSFATICAELSEAPLEITTAALTTGTEDSSILWTAATTGPAGNDVAIQIDAPAGALDLDISQSPLVIVTPAFVSATVTGTLTSDGSTPYAFDTMSFASMADGKPIFSGLVETEQCYWSGTAWVLTNDTTGIVFTSSAAVASPDLVPAGAWHTTTNPHGWKPTSPATGTPVVVVTITTAAQIVAAVEAANVASPILLRCTAELPAGTDGSGMPAAAAAVNLSGGSSQSAVYAPAWGSAYSLPEDCLRLLTIDGNDIDAPQTRFEIQGRFLLMPGVAAAPVIRYLAADPPITDWPVTFTDAVTTLLAARLAPKLTQNQGLADTLAARHEQSLGKARSKDTRETRSAENFGPRQLASRSGLVQARFAGFRPAVSTTSPEAPAAAPDLDGIFESNL